MQRLGKNSCKSFRSCEEHDWSMALIEPKWTHTSIGIDSLKKVQDSKDCRFKIFRVVQSHFSCGTEPPPLISAPFEKVDRNMENL